MSISHINNELSSFKLSASIESFRLVVTIQKINIKCTQKKSTITSTVLCDCLYLSLSNQFHLPFSINVTDSMCIWYLNILRSYMYRKCGQYTWIDYTNNFRLFVFTIVLHANSPAVLVKCFSHSQWYCWEITKTAIVTQVCGIR